mmetsp:Transcript_37603/g.86848  ORF Transcript_37603/g.86848 Transcript_37603/m.86848 type:complete len:293 (-) Transcript_37603:26-904(-)
MPTPCLFCSKRRPASYPKGIIRAQQYMLIPCWILSSWIFAWISRSFMISICSFSFFCFSWCSSCAFSAFCFSSSRFFSAARFSSKIFFASAAFCLAFCCKASNSFFELLCLLFGILGLHSRAALAQYLRHGRLLCLGVFVEALRFRIIRVYLASCQVHLQHLLKCWIQGLLVVAALAALIQVRLQGLGVILSHLGSPAVIVLLLQQVKKVEKPSTWSFFLLFDLCHCLRPKPPLNLPLSFLSSALRGAFAVLLELPQANAKLRPGLVPYLLGHLWERPLLSPLEGGIGVFRL